MNAPEILVVEDDELIGESLVRALEGEGYGVNWVKAGRVALGTISSTTRLIVLDLGLPDIDGLQVCRSIRATHSRVQILILTARREEVDVVLGLDAGADDYLSKPFRLAELLARIRARLRQGDSGRQGSGSTKVGDLQLDIAARRVFVDAQELDLRPKEFDLLALLVANVGKVVTRESAISEVWNKNWFGSTKTLDIHISALRRKLDRDHRRSRITTVRGVGYRLEEVARPTL